MIKVLFFAQLADQAEKDFQMLEFSTGMTPRSLVEHLAKTLPKQLIDELQSGATMLSVNQVFAAWDQPLSEGDEVAFLPPFSGG
ncbi:MAG: MoaD/ThiS family protein [Gammaproteobacteria bacterium]|nr:MoaD/ThiS family protein [Gammaproteobacteria bacterium]